MGFNVFKALQAIQLGMEFAELWKSSKSKAERLDLALDKADDFIVTAEGLVGKDLLREEKVRTLAEQYISVGIQLQKAIEETKALRVKAAQ